MEFNKKKPPVPDSKTDSQAAKAQQKAANFEGQSYKEPNPSGSFEKVNANSAGQPAVKKSRSFHFFENTKPGIAALITFGLLLASVPVGVIGNQLISDFGSSCHTEMAAEVYDEGASSMHIDDIFNIEEVNSFFDGNTLVATLALEKKDKNTEIWNTWVSVTLDSGEAGITNAADLDIPRMNFSADKIYVSTSFALSAYGAGIIQDHMDKLSDWISIDDQMAEVFTPYYYSWELDPEMSAPGQLSEEKIINSLPEVMPYEFHNASIIHDGIADQSGLVITEITSQYEDESYVSGSLDIVFKNEGEVVFGTAVPYSGELINGSFVFSYVCPYTLPAYDEVEVIPLPD